MSGFGSTSLVRFGVRGGAGLEAVDAPARSGVGRGPMPPRRLSSSFFVRPEGRFFVPTCLCSVTPRAAAVKDGPLGPPPEAARSVLDGGEHGVTLAGVGTAAISVPCAL